LAGRYLTLHDKIRDLIRGRVPVQRCQTLKLLQQGGETEYGWEVSTGTKPGKQWKKDSFYAREVLDLSSKRGLLRSAKFNRKGTTNGDLPVF